MRFRALARWSGGQGRNVSNSRVASQNECLAPGSACRRPGFSQPPPKPTPGLSPPGVRCDRKSFVQRHRETKARQAGCNEVLVEELAGLKPGIDRNGLRFNLDVGVDPEWILASTHLLDLIDLQAAGLRNEAAGFGFF